MNRAPAADGVARFAARLGDEWKILILRDLARGPRRFSELERNVPGICPRTLSQRLRSLQEDRLVVRRARKEPPARVEYELSERGRRLVPLIEMMRDYGERWL
ncbi:MAG: helix-turn-helix transcriptional regulator [Clostridia bacterium]|nr:helix-turn-helix transcriptional regulator [Clostridia bacterium]